MSTAPTTISNNSPTAEQASAQGPTQVPDKVSGQAPNQESVVAKQAAQKQTTFSSDLVETFLVEAWEGLQQFEIATFRLREGVDDATLQDIVMLGHRLRGSSALYGYPQISQLCDMVERLAQATPSLESSQHKQVQEFFDHVKVCLTGSLERIANGKTEGDVGLELARLGGSNILLSLLSSASASALANKQSNPELSLDTGLGSDTVLNLDTKNLESIQSKESVVPDASGVGSGGTQKEQGPSAISILVGELEHYRSTEEETLEYFLPEVKEHLDHIDQGFYELSQATKNAEAMNPDTVNQLFRSAHTLKGSSYMVELQFLGDVGHALEDIMTKVREEGMEFAEAEPVLRKGNKAVKEIIAILEGTQEGSFEQELDTSLQEFQRSLDGLLGVGTVTIYEITEELVVEEVPVEVKPLETAVKVVSKKSTRQVSGAVLTLVGELEQYRSAEEETLEYFLPEVKEHLDNIDQGIYDLSQAEKNFEEADPESVNQLFRSAHTLKGSAYMVELQFLGDVGHALEDIMIKVREEGMEFAKAEPVLRKGNKAVKEIIAILEGTQVENYRNQLDKSLQHFQRSLDELLGLGAVIIYDDILEDEQASEEDNGPENQMQKLEQDYIRALDALLGFDSSTSQENSTPVEATQTTEQEKLSQKATQVQKKSKSATTIRASVERLDDMLNLVGNLLASRTRLRNRLESFSDLSKQLEASRVRMQSVTKEFEKHYLNPQLASNQSQSVSELPAGDADINGHFSGSDSSSAIDDASKQALHKTLNERFADLEFDTYSDINILAGSIAEMVNDLTELQYQFDALGFELGHDASEIHGISQSLRSQIGRVRMVAMSHLFGRLDRLLKMGIQDDEQDIFFETIGEQVEIDNAILEAVFDPIVQIVKNAKSHGIESRNERIRKGKPAQGRITVQASYQRNSVILTIKDDGKGIDLDAVKAKAIERELITVDEAAALSDVEARQLIFNPGLSTAETITSEAGRGVGMDIVASRIRAVKGTVQVDSEKDKGSTFTLYLPLTLVISDILLVGIGRERFAVPTESIRAIERLPKDIMQLGMVDEQAGGQVGGQARGQKEQPTIIFNEMTIPVFHLAELLGRPVTQVSSKVQANALTSHADKQLMLILETAGKFYALMLDSVFDIEEVLIKSLSKRLEYLDFLLGATFSSNGDVVLLLDPNGLYNLGQERYAPQRNLSQGNLVQGNIVQGNLAQDKAISASPEPKGLSDTSVNNEVQPGASSAEMLTDNLADNLTTVDSNINAGNFGPEIVDELLDKGPQRLLLVDDSVSVRKVLSKKLERMGYEVVTAHDGQDAFDTLLRDSDFDALLTDLEMPRMNGYELIDAVRHRSNQTQKLPIIVMSTRARKEHVDLAKELGADDYLVKPVDEATLSQKLEQFI